MNEYKEKIISLYDNYNSNTINIFRMRKPADT